ncbi:MAG: hypothetical protein LQ350_005341 [Teloschistes chrysophthalmus]|nr:MAG: hypothetical protein LQ350_005341 [Niorma chrysophthalma]
MPVQAEDAPGSTMVSHEDRGQSSQPQPTTTRVPLTVGNLARHTRATDVGSGGKDWAGKWLTGSSRAAASLRCRIARKEIVMPGTGDYDEYPAIPNMVKEPTRQQEHLAGSEGVQLLSPGASNLDRSEHSDGFTRPNNSRARENMAEQDRSVELANNARMALIFERMELGEMTTEDEEFVGRANPSILQKFDTTGR